MKIALVILHADVARGGAERYTLDLAASLVRRGHEVSILASSFQNENTAGARVLLPAVGFTRTRRYLRFLDELDLHLTRVNYDVVHAMLPVRRCDVYHPHAGVAAASPGNLFNPRRKMFAVVEGKLLTSASPPVVLCLSNLIQEVVQRNYSALQKSKLALLFNGIDLTRFDPAARPESKNAVRKRFEIRSDAIVGLLLAQDFERKGLRQAMEAVARVEDPRLILLVGGKQDTQPYRRLAEKLGIHNQVVFAGPVENPADFYRAANFFVLPTRFDPCSLVVLEALAMGLPVISTVKNGACEIMVDGVHGYILSDPANISALVDAMGNLLVDNRIVDMRRACLELRPILSQEHHLDRLETIYSNIMSQKCV